MAKDLKMNITFDKSELENIVKEAEQRIMESCLTREQAIKRIRDIQSGAAGDARSNFPEKAKGSLAKRCWNDDLFSYGMEYGAIAELMAIFDIKEDEL